MKRASMLFVLVALAVMAAAAQGMMGGPPWARSSYAKLFGTYQKAEYEALRSELGDKTLGELRGSELLSWTDRFSIARQKDAWVVSSMGASMMFPGRGQFMNKDGLGGGLFMAAHIATFAATLTAWYFVLPADLRFDKLNYYTSSWSTIKAGWEGKSLEDYLPSIGVLAGGGLVDMVWRAWSGRSALTEARVAIDEGRVTFQPLDGALGLGLRMRY